MEIAHAIFGYAGWTRFKIDLIVWKFSFLQYEGVHIYCLK